MAYKHPLLVSVVSHPANSEACYVHITSSKIFQRKPKSTVFTFYFNFTYFCSQ